MFYDWNFDNNMKKTRGFSNPAKGFLNRRRGVMKKANMLSKLTGAHIAVLCEYNGKTYVYESDKHFSPILNNVRAAHRFGPDHFETVADRATTSYGHNAKVPRHRPSLPPYISSASSSCSQPDGELPVVTLGSPLCSASQKRATAWIRELPPQTRELVEEVSQLVIS
jgi:hypothetical protein